MWLRRSDLEAVVGFLEDLDALGLAEPYPADMFDRLQALVPCDGAGYQDADVEARAFIDNHPVDSEDDEALYWAVGPCPIVDYRARTGDLSAVRMSDVIGRRRYHELPFYREYFKPVSLDHVLDMGLSAAKLRFRSLVLLRGHDAPDFSERDLAVMELLRPHLRAREAMADLRRRVDEATKAPAADEPQDAGSGLTTREREIIRLVAAGKTNAQIAADLWVTPGTIKKHLENVYIKLGVTGRAAAASRMGSGPGVAV